MLNSKGKILSKDSMASTDFRDLKDLMAFLVVVDNFTLSLTEAKF
jgi:hypothetical protein